jgi:hypothetical protein
VRLRIETTVNLLSTGSTLMGVVMCLPLRPPGEVDDREGIPQDRMQGRIDQQAYEEISEWRGH